MNRENLVLLSSEHGTRSSSNSFEIVMGGNHILTKKCVAITPVQIWAPNIFPNIKRDSKLTIEVMPSGSGPLELEILSGQYSNTELALIIQNAVLETALIDFTVTINSFGQFVFTNNSTDTVFIEWSDEPLLNQLGFIVADQPAISPIGPTMTLTAGSIMTGELPYLGGEQVVTIKCNRMGDKNCVHGKDALPYDICFSVPLNKTPYGGTACYKPGNESLMKITYENHTQLDTLRFEVLDGELNPLTLPPNYHIRMLFRNHHQES